MGGGKEGGGKKGGGKEGGGFAVVRGLEMLPLLCSGHTSDTVIRPPTNLSCYSSYKISTLHSCLSSSRIPPIIQPTNLLTPTPLSVAEAKTIRREITRIAKDYDLEWKGELENLDPASSQSQDPSKPGSSSSSSSATSSSSSSSIGPHPKDENGEKLDIDKTIDEASELAEQSQVRSKKEKAAQRKGEGGDREGEKGRRRREDEGVKRGKELVGK